MEKTHFDNRTNLNMIRKAESAQVINIDRTIKARTISEATDKDQYFQFVTRKLK